MAALLTLPASAVDLTTQKLFGKWTLTPTSFGLGADPNTAALSPKWIVVGDAGAADRGLSLEGGVQVFNAATGAFVRKLLPPSPVAANQRFGGAVALAGDIAVVGAYSTNGDQGRAYIYNLATGALLRTLNASDGAALDQFGQNVATNGVIAAIAAPNDDAFRGAVYLFNVATGVQIEKLTAFDGAGAHYYGFGMTLEGNILAVGADGNATNRGAVYFYDLSKPVGSKLIKKFQPGASVAGDHVGAALAMHQGRVVIGNYVGLSTGKVFLHNLATNSDSQITLGGTNTSFGGTVAIHGPILAVSEHTQGQGRVHLFKSSDGSFIRTILPPNGDTNPQRFGFAIALDGTKLLATAPDDSAQASTAGAAHLIGPLTVTMDYTKVVGKGDFAPSAPGVPPGISYGTLSDAFANPSGETIFSCTLTGADSNGGRDQGVFSNVAVPAVQQLLLKSRQLYSGTAFFGVPSRLSMNDDNLAIGFSTLTGSGVNASNNLLLWFKTNTSQGTLLRTGTAVPAGALTGHIPTSIPEAVTSVISGDKGMAAICTLKVGTAGVTATSDSALYSNKVGTSDNALREGFAALAPLPVGSQLGQFAPRIAMHSEQQVFSTALTGTGITAATNAAVFRKVHAFNEILVAQKGVTAVTDKDGVTLPGTVNYSAFIGESANGDEGAVYRATILGTNVTAATNEGVWTIDSVPQRRLAFRKGQTLTPLPGLTIARIISFWSIGYSSPDFSQVLALVQLAGAGVNAATDQALITFQTDGTHNILLREGDPAPGCLGAKIGVISRIEADAWDGNYALLATLTGATTTSDLALYTGSLLRGNSTTQAALRRPFLRMRKGQLFDNQPSKVKSIYLPSSSVTASGAGGTGRGRALSWTGQFTFTVEFDNGIRQIMKGLAD